MDYFKREKNVLVSRFASIFLKIALSFWNSMAPSSCQQFPLNSCFTQLPSLCGTGFREFSASKESKGASLWCSGKESAYQSRRGGFDPWFRKIPSRRRWQPTQVLSLKSPWTEEPGRLQSKRWQRVGHDWAQQTHIHTKKHNFGDHKKYPLRKSVHILEFQDWKNSWELLINSSFQVWNKTIFLFLILWCSKQDTKPKVSLQHCLRN